MRKRMLIKKLVLFLFVAGLIYVAVLHYFITRNGNETPKAGADYMIILGARVKGDIPSLALKARIEAPLTICKIIRKLLRLLQAVREKGRIYRKQCQSRAS